MPQLSAGSKWQYRDSFSSRLGMNLLYPSDNTDLTLTLVNGGATGSSWTQQSRLSRGNCACSTLRLGVNARRYWFYHLHKANDDSMHSWLTPTDTLLFATSDCCPCSISTHPYSIMLPMTRARRRWTVEEDIILRQEVEKGTPHKP